MNILTTWFDLTSIEVIEMPVFDDVIEVILDNTQPPRVRPVTRCDNVDEEPIPPLL